MGQLSNTCRRLPVAGAYVLIISIAIATAAVAHAQPGAGDADDRDARARVLYNEAEGDYAAGRYEEAARKFTKAYELSERSALLFNVANAYERMGEYQKAADNLKLYLKGPKVRDVVSVRERIRRLEAAVVAKKKAEAAERARAEAEAAEKAKSGDSGNDQSGPGDGESDTGALPDPIAQSANSDTGKSRFSRQRQVYALAGTSAVALVGTIAFGLASRSAAADAEGFCTGGGGVCLEGAKGALQSERQYAVLADLSLGVAVITAGASLWLLLRPSGKREAKPRTSRVVPFLMPNGLGVGVSGAL